MEEKRFKMIDENFVCLNCGKDVPKAGYTARDHCPYCLCSLHVDNNPGDRANNCHGILKPVGVEKFKKTYKIIYKCSKCGMIKKNILATDDDFDTFLEIMKNVDI